MHLNDGTDEEATNRRNVLGSKAHTMDMSISYGASRIYYNIQHITYGLE